MAKLKTKQNNTTNSSRSWQGCWKKGTTQSLPVGVQTGTAFTAISIEVTQEAENLPQGPNYIFWAYNQRSQNLSTGILAHPCLLLLYSKLPEIGSSLAVY